MFKDTQEDSSFTETKPEWIRIPEAVRIFGIFRTKFYMLINEGRFTSVSLRERFQIRGTRLINYDSLNDYIHSCGKTEPPNKGNGLDCFS